MYGIFPHIVELVVFTSHIIVKYWLLFDSFESSPGLLSVVFVFAWRAHLNHVKYVLCVWVFLLPQVQHFELLTRRRFMPLNCNVSKGSQ